MAGQYPIQWQIYSNLRCISDRMGGYIPGYQHRRSMVKGGERFSHQPSRAQGSIFCSADVCFPQEECSCAAPHRQHNSDCVYQLQRRYLLPSSARPSLEPMGMVHGEVDHDSCGAHSWEGQQGSRHEIQTDLGLKRLEAEFKAQSILPHAGNK